MLNINKHKLNENTSTEKIIILTKAFLFIAVMFTDKFHFIRIKFVTSVCASFVY
jgi:hypothetical protein